MTIIDVTVELGTHEGYLIITNATVAIETRVRYLTTINITVELGTHLNISLKIYQNTENYFNWSEKNVIDDGFSSHLYRYVTSPFVK